MISKETLSIGSLYLIQYRFSNYYIEEYLGEEDGVFEFKGEDGKIYTYKESNFEVIRELPKWLKAVP